ncbi:hypothetical protein XELAEV_18041422mg [Xenopus laevis]|uniref:Uncharacterized protein n=1 Tax=Xenopus laevis TaxID=8355 RepID=A0A974C274_XENLA|nr:hypothetical protein XELAEV_18041422mg [Xenopus laevis]
MALSIRSHLMTVSFSAGGRNFLVCGGYSTRLGFFLLSGILLAPMDLGSVSLFSGIAPFCINTPVAEAQVLPFGRGHPRHILSVQQGFSLPAHFTAGLSSLPPSSISLCNLIPVMRCTCTINTCICLQFCFLVWAELIGLYLLISSIVLPHGSAYGTCYAYLYLTY